MFTCKACLSRAFHTLITHFARPNRSLPTLLPTYTSTQSRQCRRYVTATFTEATKKDETYDGATENKKGSSRTSPALKKLQKLEDPLHIANLVKETLDEGNFLDAVEVTRRASKFARVSVSWNHLIDYQLKHDRLQRAVNLYNEMKKRNQLPNAQTFTIIFRGFAASSHPKLAAAEAVRIYTTMIHNSRIKPNTIHMNAVMQVCAKAGNIDSLFSIVETANDGLRAPNNLTYTIMLNSLQARLRKHYLYFDFPDLERLERQTISQARTIWGVVNWKWRTGSIIIDEELVCAMGRVLLEGSRYDALTVEALLEETMKIKIKKKIPQDNKHAVLQTTDLAASRPIKASKKTYPLPGNNSLSMILEAIGKSGNTTKIDGYWQIFTREHHIVPDANNWQELLTALHRGRNSAKTVSTLRAMPVELMVPKTFRTAMSTCLRDNLNPSAFAHATEVLEILLSKPKNSRLASDPLIFRLYLRVAYANKPPRVHLLIETDDAVRTVLGNQLASALDHLWKPYLSLARQYECARPRSNKKRELIALARKMIATCDRLISNNMVPPHVAVEIAPKRNSLNRVVVRHFEQMKELDPKFRMDQEKKDKDWREGPFPNTLSDDDLVPGWWTEDDYIYW